MAVSAANQNNAELGVINNDADNRPTPGSTNNRINQKLDGDNMTSPGTTNDRTGISQDQRMGNERMPVDQEVLVLPVEPVLASAIISWSW